MAKSTISMASFKHWIWGYPPDHLRLDGSDGQNQMATELNVNQIESSNESSESNDLTKVD